jgi:RNA recognition motif-containing protein
MIEQIVIENLTRNVNEGHLKEIFGAYGDILEIDMPNNKACMDYLVRFLCLLSKLTT